MKNKDRSVAAIEFFLGSFGLALGVLGALCLDITWHSVKKPLRLAFVTRASRYDPGLQEKMTSSVNLERYSYEVPLPIRFDYVDRNKEWKEGFVNSESLAFTPSTCAPSRTTLGLSGDTVWDTEYCTTEHGYRKVPEPSPYLRKDKFLAFVGCSFTYGTGVADHETLPAQLSLKLSDHQLYNFGFPAVSLAEFLADSKLNAKPIWRNVSETKGMFVYYFLDAHINRFARTISTTNYWFANRRPVFAWPNSASEPQYLGLAGGVAPLSTKFKLYLSRSQILRTLHFDYPRVNALAIKRYAAVVRSFKQEVLRHYPQGKFVVLLDPTLDAYPEFSDELKGADIDQINLAQLDFERILGSGASIPYDGHPTAEFYQLMAEVVAPEINKRYLFEGGRDG
jgi:hypothetical protein